MCSPGPPWPLAASNAMSKNTLLRQYVAEPTTAAASPTLPLLAPLGGGSRLTVAALSTGGGCFPVCCTSSSNDGIVVVKAPLPSDGISFWQGKKRCRGGPFQCQNNVQKSSAKTTLLRLLIPNKSKPFFIMKRRR